MSLARRRGATAHLERMLKVSEARARAIVASMAGCWENRRGHCSSNRCVPVPTDFEQLDSRQLGLPGKWFGTMETLAPGVPRPAVAICAIPWVDLPPT